MNKIWIVACREYRAIVGTKAFLTAIVMMPVLTFGGIVVQKMLEGRVGPTRVVPWFFVYQVLAVMLFGSIFMAIGAAVTQLKEAQSMLLPIWLVLTFPLFIWLQVVREPLGPLATWASFFPPATPLLMVLRIGATGAVPWWQCVLGVVILLAATLACVLVAARIFRIGFLSQGKSPRMTELLRWAMRG